MRLDAEAKRNLVATYMPVLLVASADVGLPVDPAQYVARSALWAGTYPDLDDPSGWGVDASPEERGPIVARGGLTLDSLPVAQRLLMRKPGEYWLDCSGWLSSSKVTTSTDNRQANLVSLRARFEDQSSTPTLRAEVCDVESWRAIGATSASREILGLEADELLEILADTVIVNYIFLFPGHRGHAADVFADGMAYGADDYEADWACFSVVLSSRDMEVNALEPRFAAFSRRFRSQSEDFGADGTILRFRTVPWKSVPKIGRQACVIAATGTHNLYPADIATEEVQIAPQSASMGYADNLTDDMEGWVGHAVTSNTQVPAAVVAVTLAKMAAANAVAGPIGALGGLLAGVLEAGAVSDAVSRDPGLPEFDPSTTSPPDGELEDPRDGFSDDAELSGHTIVSGPVEPNAIAEVLGQLTFGTSISRQLLWAGRSYVPIDRASEPFWPVYGGSASTGFIGRWGVRCNSDPFDRRAGDILPDFRMEVVRNLLAQLGK